ncbi:MAG: alpha-galactosidase [Armatimonadetes bacterium]|nr:alpha-galactosidase [Armatimonadota bacterium]
MKRLLLVAFLCFLLAQAALSRAYPAGSTDISVSQARNREVRFTSGKTLCVEGLVDGIWSTRYWAADGRPNVLVSCPYPEWFTPQPAFYLEVKDDPAQPAKPLSGGWEWVSGRELPRTERGSRHFVVELANQSRPIAVRLHTLLDGTPFIVRWLDITNKSDKSVALSEVYPWSGRLWGIVYNFEVGHQPTSVSPCDPPFGWTALPDGKTGVESVMGNGYDDPFFMVRRSDGAEYFVGYLAWSANWKLELECDRKESSPTVGLSFKFGPSAKNVLRVVSPGETVTTPAVHLGHLEGDFDEAVQAVHEHVRRSVRPPLRADRNCLIQYDAPADQGVHPNEKFNEENVLKEIDLAAAVGVEMFIMDIGWYDVFGEWVPSQTRFPRGLGPIREYARSKGMLFGLQTEIEGGRGNWEKSRLMKEHPDWFGKQNMLYLDRSEVASYFEKEIMRVLGDSKPDLYRHEYIPGWTYEGLEVEREGFVENNYWRYYDSLYAIWDSVLKEYPDLIMQAVDNGGTRDDLANKSRFHETYFTESEIPRGFVEYSGKSISLPPEMLIMGLGLSQKRGPLDTHLRMVFGIGVPHMVSSIDPTLDELTPERKERYLHYANIYKSFIRPIMPTCKVYHHAPVSAARGGAIVSRTWFAMEFASPDKTKAWATLARTGVSEHDPDVFIFRPKGLSRSRTYQVTFDSEGEVVSIDGHRLMQDGLAIRLESNGESELLLFEARE